MTDIAGRPALPDEHIVWQGQPVAGLIFRSLDSILIPLSVIWLGFVIAWNVSVLDIGAPMMFWVVGSVFLLMGLYTTFGRFLMDMRARQRMRYFVTNQRIVIENAFGGRTTLSLDMLQLPPIKVEERTDGSGTIRFGKPQSMWALLFSQRNPFSVWQPTLDPTPQFLWIPNVRSVYALIQQQLVH